MNGSAPLFTAAPTKRVLAAILAAVVLALLGGGRRGCLSLGLGGGLVVFEAGGVGLYVLVNSGGLMGAENHAGFDVGHGLAFHAVDLGLGLGPNLDRGLVAGVLLAVLLTVLHVMLDDDAAGGDPDHLAANVAAFVLGLGGGFGLGGGSALGGGSLVLAALGFGDDDENEDQDRD